MAIRTALVLSSAVLAPVHGFAQYYCAGRTAAQNAFAALTSTGEIVAWGHSAHGGSGAPSGTGYTLFSSGNAFAALTPMGEIRSWGNPGFGGRGAPAGSGYTNIFSTRMAFAALTASGEIRTWGDATRGGRDPPSGSGYTTMFSTDSAFVALKANGEIRAWGHRDFGGSGAPAGTGYRSIASSQSAFAALTPTGEIRAWGSGGYQPTSNFGGSGAPSGSGFISIVSGHFSFAALKSTGEIRAWGSATHGGSGAPTGSGYTAIFASDIAYAALTSTGEIYSWGHANGGGSGAPAGSGHTFIYSSPTAFAALTSTGEIHAWGNPSFGGSGAPAGTGYTFVASGRYAFAALSSTGEIRAWGHASYGGSGAPAGAGYTTIVTNQWAFAAISSTGEIRTWGLSSRGGTGAQVPSGGGYHFPNNGIAWGYNMRNTCGQSSVAPTGANGDPHLSLPHGGRADFRGEHKALYNFLSAKNLSLNVMTELADFELHTADHERHKDVHGSFLTQAHIVARTNTGKTVRVSFWADAIDSKNIGNANGTVDSEPAFFLQKMIQSDKEVDDVKLHMDYSSLHVTTPEFEIVVTPRLFRLERNVVGLHHRLDLKIMPRVAESAFAVAPHGIIGQGWDGDGKAINGERDAFPVKGEFTTYAMAKGAIEGVPNDYKVASPYATDFKFSRFDVTSAAPRDVAKLVAAGELNTPGVTFDGDVVGSIEITDEHM